MGSLKYNLMAEIKKLYQSVPVCNGAKNYVSYSAHHNFWDKDSILHNLRFVIKTITCG